MRSGHREAQSLFLALGRKLGYPVRLQWSRHLPTDGVWLAGGRHPRVAGLPLVALEVVVTEGPKSVRGSIATLAAVSPSLGVLLVNEEEIRRVLIRDGVAVEAVDRSLGHQLRHLDDLLRTTNQRFEIWSFAHLRRKYELATG